MEGMSGLNQGSNTPLVRVTHGDMSDLEGRGNGAEAGVEYRTKCYREDSGHTVHLRAGTVLQETGKREII